MTGFGLNKDERVMIAIDGPNLYAAAKSLGIDMVDFRAIVKQVQKEAQVKRAYYYTAIQEEADGTERVRPLLDLLEYNGFKLRTKPTKSYEDSTGRRKVKGNTDVEMTVDMMLMAPHVDHIILFTGDGDFCAAIEAVQNMGVRVTVVSTMQTQPAMIADELRRQADAFVEIMDIRQIIDRNYSADRPAPRPQGTRSEPAPARGGGGSDRSTLTTKRPTTTRSVAYGERY